MYQRLLISYRWNLNHLMYGETYTNSYCFYEDIYVDNIHHAYNDGF